MTEEEAIEIAKTVAIREGWTWRGVVGGQKEGGIWRVSSNIGMRGMNVHVHIDDQTQEVVYKSYGPR